MKGSGDTEGMSAKVFGQYVGACAVSLARADAQSVNASMLHGDVGNGDAVSAAVPDWSYAYAEKTLADFHQLGAAAKAGQIPVADEPLRCPGRV